MRIFKLIKGTNMITEGFRIEFQKIWFYDNHDTEKH